MSVSGYSPVYSGSLPSARTAGSIWAAIAQPPLSKCDHLDGRVVESSRTALGLSSIGLNGWWRNAKGAYSSSRELGTVFSLFALSIRLRPRSRTVNRKHLKMTRPGCEIERGAGVSLESFKRRVPAPNGVSAQKLRRDVARGAPAQIFFWESWRALHRPTAGEWIFVEDPRAALQPRRCRRGAVQCPSCGQCSRDGSSPLARPSQELADLPMASAPMPR